MNEMTTRILKEITKAKQPKKMTIRVKRTISNEEKIISKIDEALKDGGF